MEAAIDHILLCHDIVKTDFVRAEGCCLIDSQDCRYTDFESGIWCTALGHNHPRIQKVMIDQTGKVIHLGTRYPHELAEKAAQAVCNISGLPDGKVVFLSSGSEAVEFGVQAARRLTGRSRLLTFTHTYLSAYGASSQKTGDEWLYFDLSACAGCTASHQCDVDCPHIQTIPFDSIAALVFDGGNAHGAVRPPPYGLLRMLAAQVSAHGGMLVANEVTSGMGRTGEWFGYQHYDLQPDVVAAGKGLGNGYPVSAAVLSRKAAEALEQTGFRYAQSHQNDPLGCAVAYEVIQVMRDEALIERSCRVGEAFLAQLQALANRHAGVKEARGRGLMIVLELYPEAVEGGAAGLYTQLLELGFLVGVTPADHVLRFYPPLTIPESEITRLVETLDGLLAGEGRHSPAC